MSSAGQRPVHSAVIVAVGSELTQGETHDTNSGDLARQLSRLGVVVDRLMALPDDQPAVEAALVEALARADLVLTTGGLGPTPDDLTREAIAAVLGERPSVDPQLEAWLRDLFERRGQRMSEMNRKQAWLIPSASALANEQGTAPGWWVERPDGGLLVALPGPPREMHPMWRREVLPRLERRGLGGDRWSRTLRLTGIGESAAAELIGEAILRASQPSVATYARSDSVDVRISAVAANGEQAAVIGERCSAQLEERLREHVFARDDEGWPEALGRRLAGRSLGVVEIGTGGRLIALLGTAPWLTFAEALGPGTPQARAHRDLGRFAERVREAGPADIGLAVRARERAGDTAVTIAVASEEGTHRETRLAFLGGFAGQHRAALAACAALWKRLERTAS
jgi:nicotinamide-nucleotide amidase